MMPARPGCNRCTAELLRTGSASYTESYRQEKDEAGLIL
jgi:hypothetical protein